MKGKYKLTRFARFIIFLALISPLCYVAGPFVLELDMEDAMNDFIQGYNDVEENKDTLDLEEVEELQEDIEDLREDMEDIESELKEKELLLKEILTELKEV